MMSKLARIIFICCGLFIACSLFCKSDSIGATITKEREDSLIYDEVWEYQISRDGKTAYIIKYHGDDEFVKIPERIDDYDITYIDEGAFSENKCIKEVKISKNVQELSDYVFMYSSLEKVIFDTQELKNLGDNCFSCTAIKEIRLPGTIKNIGRECFSGCKKLKTVEAEDGFLHFDEYTFVGCENLEKIYLPKSFDRWMFEDYLECSSLQEIVVDEDNPKFCSEDGVFYNKDKTYLLIYPCNKKDEVYTLPGSVKKVVDDAFYRVNNLAEIRVDKDNTEYISQDGVLYTKDMMSLIKYPPTKKEEEYIIPASVKSIIPSFDNIEYDEYCTSFSNEKNLKNIYVDKNNQYFKSLDGVLYSKDGSILVRYPGAREETMYSIPDEVTSIWDTAFDDNRDRLTLEVGFGCSGYYYAQRKEISYRLKIDDKWGSFTDAGFIYSDVWECVKNSDNTITIIRYIGDEENVIIPSEIQGKKVVSLADYAFEHNGTLKSITLPGTLKNIGKYVFAYCYGLKKAVLKNGIINNGEGLFYRCWSLSSVSYPKSYRIYSNDDFYLCGLTKYTVAKSNPYFSTKNGILYNKKKTKLIAYPRYKTGKSYTIPKSVKTVAEDAFDGCWYLKYIYVNKNNKKYSSINGVLFTKNKKTIVRFPEGRRVKYYTVPAKVNKIKKLAFKNFTGTLIVKKGSKAEKYAKKYSISYAYKKS